MSDKDFIMEDEGVVVDTIPEVEEDETDGYEKVCMMCHRPESVAGKMMELPNNMTICYDCMQKSMDYMKNTPFDYSQLMNMNMPGIQFFSTDDLEQLMPKQQKIKTKKPSEKTKPVFDINNIPAPHKIKAQLD